MEALLFVACLLFLCLSTILFDSVQTLQVPCLDQDEYCECPVGETKCEFLLTIEELQTFTSYVVDSSGDELTRGTPGNVYNINETFNSAPVNRNTPESNSNKCFYENLVTERDFRSKNCSFPMTVDGNTFRLFIGVNGRIPGPTLIVDHGALVRARVKNDLSSEGVTIHWHGMYQRGSPWMDGVGFISQAPITPGAFFDYVFTANPPGTHWYHSHVGAQRSDGVFGALIVREKNFGAEIVPAILQELPDASFTSIQDLPRLHTMTLLDWQREASLDLFVRIHSSLASYPTKPVGVLPQSSDLLYRATVGPDLTEVGPIPFWSGLINGRGRHYITDPSPLSVFTVVEGGVYRFRVVGAQSVYAYSLSIDNHKLHVIATDGHFIQPVEVKFLIVHSGERYDFILEANQGEQEFYWIRAKTIEVNAVLQPGEEHSARAVLKYGSREDDTEFDWRTQNVPETSTLCTSSQPCDVLNCPFKMYPNDEFRNCIPLTSLRLLSPAFSPVTLSSLCEGFESGACTTFLNFGFEGISVTSAINGRNFRLPVTPYQTSCGQYNEYDRGDCDGCTEDNLQACRCVHVEEIMREEKFDPDSIKTQIMVLSAAGEMGLREFGHPVHLHGHSFRVLYIGYGEYNLTTNALIETTTDVTCNGETLCMNPSWRGGRMPDHVRETLLDDLDTHILKDTVNVPAGGYVVAAFPADNPGYWFLHCHIEVHQLEGMGVLIEEYNHTEHRKPPHGINEIGNFQLEISEFLDLPELTCGSSADTVAVAVLFVVVNALCALAVV